ncbi:hypothetical protein J8273_8363 [Carpediemonas membranifera]|uniref:Uncharacterized protein n=1 Tax=Carpediemonas membranifera TaxID=201153 RepID=A0A8J6B0E8_9EUKA|nr:hypothetical protein J8273_8363 [Carpediemonas membranifera]|eukprot:KAG9390317.1 hypothetical protein J8273_8363 [Carpediemonas membranifera]
MAKRGIGGWKPIDKRARHSSDAWTGPFNGRSRRACDLHSPVQHEPEERMYDYDAVSSWAECVQEAVQLRWPLEKGAITRSEGHPQPSVHGRPTQYTYTYTIQRKGGQKEVFTAAGNSMAEAQNLTAFKLCQEYNYLYFKWQEEMLMDMSEEEEEEDD